MLGFVAFAQDETETYGKPSKGDSEYLSQAGDIGLGIDGTPFFDYFGNMFNGTTNNSLNLGTNTLYFRYFLADDAAVRIMLGIRTIHNVSKYYVQDDAAVFVNPLSREQLVDRRTYFGNGYAISAGYQMFRSYKKLRGFFGADLGYTFTKDKYVYEYGNQMTEVNPAPTSYYWGNVSERPLEYNYGANQNISLGIFTGAEYYFLPKVCIGAEFGLTSGISFTGQSFRTQERMVISQHVEEQIATNPPVSSWFVQTLFPYPYFGGTLYFMVHF
jgi:hypothetical protein